jgi:V8-like Glu-specific endopeptidase
MLTRSSGPRALLAALTAATALMVAMLAPAGAITDGELDGDGHPYVGLMVAQDKKGTPLWRCSGSLISARVFLTAGHCTEPPAAKIQIWFDADVESGIPDNGYPFTGDVSGKPYVHPDYDPNAFFLRDLGVVVLNAAFELDEYAELPEVDQLDVLRPGRDTTFTAVGYGRQKSYPDAAMWKNEAFRVRMVAYPWLHQINGGIVGDFSLLLSNNAHSGGTCFGDSGGPNLLGDSSVIAGITSFGLNGNCAGTGGVYRLDRDWNLDWLEDKFGKLF